MAMFTELQTYPPFDPTTHARLIQEARAASFTEQAWLCLEAAHVVGQSNLKTHVQTHAHMLGLAWRTRDWPETAGQVLRLALVPVGHLIRRLPQGNPGRATVGAFRPMPVRPELNALISRVLENTPCKSSRKVSQETYP